MEKQFYKLKCASCDRILLEVDTEARATMRILCKRCKCFSEVVCVAGKKPQLSAYRQKPLSQNTQIV